MKEDNEYITFEDLDELEGFRNDNSGKSIAYFCKSLPVKVDFKLIKQLKNKAKTKVNVRLCLHTSPDSKFHNMIVLGHKGKYYRPHKHKDKDESFHIIEGSMAAFIFDENGDIFDSCILKPKEYFVLIIPHSTYHTLIPLSDIVIYHESKVGPFKDNDSIYPNWAPDGSNEKEVKKYKNTLMKFKSYI